MSGVKEAWRNGTYGKEQGRKFAIEIDEIKSLANMRVLSLAKHLLPNGRENCGFWEVGSVAGERGQSLKLNLAGGNKGLWTDFSAAKGDPSYSGNLIQLVAQVRFGGNVGEAIKWLISWLGIDGLDPERLGTVKAQARKAARDAAADAAKEGEKKRARAHGLFLSGVPIAGTPAETYLCARGIDLRALGLAAPGSLRFHPEVPCIEAGRDAKGQIRKLPAMIAAVVGFDGRHLATHRTWLRADGRDKADLTEAKKAMGAFKGGFIPVWKGEQRCSLKGLKPTTKIYASEGIEDALSVAIARPEERIISAVSLSNLRNLELPAGCPLYLLGQRDEEMQALDSFDAAVSAHQEQGREVYIVPPPAGYKDWNAPIDRRGVGG